MKQFWGKTWSFFINLIHSFISYGIAAVQRANHPSLHSCLGWVLNIYCRRRDVAGIVVDRGESCSPAAWDQKQGFPQLLNSTQLQPLRYKMKVKVCCYYASLGRRVGKHTQLFRSGFPISWWEDLLPGGEKAILSANGSHSRHTITDFRLFLEMI